MWPLGIICSSKTCLRFSDLPDLLDKAIGINTNKAGVSDYKTFIDKSRRAGGIWARDGVVPVGTPA